MAQLWYWHTAIQLAKLLARIAVTVGSSIKAEAAKAWRGSRH